MNDKPNNIILLVLDDLRYDRINKKTMPFLTRLAKDNYFFTNCTSTAPWSPPSYASIFSGLYPFQHGIKGETLMMNSNVKTLADILMSKGYKTIGGSLSPHISVHRKFDKGFDEFFDLYDTKELLKQGCAVRPLILKKVHKSLSKIPGYDGGKIEKIIKKFAAPEDSGAFIVNEFVKYICKRIPERQPHFLFGMYLETHGPYTHVPKNYKNDKLIKTDKGVKIAEDPIKYFNLRKQLNTEDIDSINSHYDRAANYLDYKLKELFGFFKGKKVLDDTTIFIIADHGELLGEHNLIGHYEFSLFEELLHVPLIAVTPGEKKRQEIDAPVQSIDIFTTICEMLGIKINKELYSGIDLFGNIPDMRTIFAECEGRSATLDLIKKENPEFNKKNFDRSLKMIKRDKYKLISASDGTYKLYNLKEDPQEKVDISGRAENILERLKREMDMLLSQYKKIEKNGSTVIDDNEVIKQRLKDLGYI
ncbi:MAG: sulfatase [Elusimicrobiota bacterium]